MVISPEIDAQNVLVCPACNSPNLHQTAISTFFRKEDAVEGVFKKIDSSGVFYTHPNRNPSPRRTGFLIAFACEQCNADPELAIYQHKGSTYVEWETIRKALK